MYPPHHLGGYELSCRDVMVRLAARGHRVHVLTSDFRVPGVDEPDDESVEVRRDLQLYLDRDATALRRPGPLGRAGIERANQRALRAAIDESHPDVVAVWHLGGTSIGLLATLMGSGLPIVYAICDDWLSYATELDAWARAFRRRPRLGRFVSAVTGLPTCLGDVGNSGTFCFVSELTRRRAERDTPWEFPDATVVFSGIDLALFPPLPRPAGPWGGELLYAGRLDPRKGVETLLRALASLPPATRLTVLSQGESVYRERLLSLAGELGVSGRVRFERVPRHEMAERYRAADAVVFPSQWEEPFGLVPLEAMACSTPVAATGAGGSGEFLRDGVNCVRFAPGEPEDLARAVTSLAGDAGLRRRIVAGGLATASQLGVDRLADTFESWYVAAAAGFREGRPPDRHLDLDHLASG